MKALTLTQPWATLVAIGEKLIETRSWSTSHRGVIAIHAAKGYPPDARYLRNERPFSTVLGSRTLPTAAIIAVANLRDCWRFGLGRDSEHPRARFEDDFGDFTPGRYGFELESVAELTTPVPCRGMLGLWEVPPEIIAEIQKVWT